MFIPIVWLVTWVMNICNYFTIINYNLTDEIKSKAFIQIRIIIYAKVFIVENKKNFQTSVLKLYVYKTVFLSAVETKNTFVKVKLMQIVLMLWGSKQYFQ